MLPSTYMAATVSDLIADINAANAAGGTNTITLVANKNFNLNGVDNTVDGPTGLPVIAAGDNLTIIGNGDVIQRTNGAPAFRLLDIGSGASLTLENLTLQNGLAFGSGVAAEGGSVYNQGTLALNGVIVQGNIAQGSAGMNGTKASPNGTSGQGAVGGGIWSNGALTLENGTLIQNTWAAGGNGGSSYYYRVGYGGTAFGGGVYIAAGAVTLAGVTFTGNGARGGVGGSAP